MLQQALIVLLDVWCYLDCVNGRAATFLLDVGAETKGLSTAAWILALVAAVLEFRLLGMISTMEELTSYKLRFADCTIKRD